MSATIARALTAPLRWTNRQYQELDRLDGLRGTRLMLLRGELYVREWPTPLAATVIGLVDDWLRKVVPDGHHVRCQNGFEIGADSNPVPDLAVVPGAIRDYGSRHPTMSVLIVEVAESSLFVDTTTKAELYATAGVPDYWVIDLEHRQLIVLRDPQPLPAGLGATAYRTRLALGPADAVAPLAAPAADARVADLLP